LPSDSAGKFLEKFGIWEIWGDTTTPLLSAECQNGLRTLSVLRAPRDTGVLKKSTNCQQIANKFSYYRKNVFLCNA